MRTLVIAADLPARQAGAGRMRLYHTLLALERLGTVDLAAIVGPGEAAGPLPAGLPVRRALLLPRPGRTRPRPAARARQLLAGGLPYDFAARDYRPLRAAFAAWAAGGHDLVWHARLEGHAALADLAGGAPAVLDLDDLEDRKILGRRRLQRADPHGWDLHPPERRLWTAREARQWRALQRRAVRRAAAVLLCSELDRARLGAPHGLVAPNGYEAPAAPRGRLKVGDPPTVLLPGSLTYPPNVDAAWFLIRRILPPLAARVPGVRVVLAGRADGRLDRSRLPAAVVLTGWVDDMAVELARADLVAVPLRYGSGTRVKILEAFAHRVPVVSTGLGAEGLGALDGRHLLVRDGAAAFADACAALLSERALRARLTGAAHELFLRRYQWRDLLPAIGAGASAALVRR
jgi:glycosyltransferase involved in cell wall biosynthesis